MIEKLINLVKRFPVTSFTIGYFVSMTLLWYFPQPILFMAIFLMGITSLAMVLGEFKQ